MIYKKISSRVIIGRMVNAYSINTTDWITRCPVWIADAMADMHIYAALEKVSKELTIEDGTVMLPCDLKLLVGINYQGSPLHRVNNVGSEYGDMEIIKYHPVHTYEINNDAHIVTSFDSGTITVHYKSSPFKYDDELAVYFPIIPDDDIFKRALEWYLLTRILQRGYKIIGYSLKDNSPYTNPAIAYDVIRKKARNSVNSLDKGERDKISRIMRSFLINDDEHEFNME